MYRVLVHIPEYFGHNRGPGFLDAIKANLANQENMTIISAKDEYGITDNDDLLQTLRLYRGEYDVLVIPQDSERLTNGHASDLQMLERLSEVTGSNAVVAYVDGSVDEIEHLLIEAGVTESVTTDAHAQLLGTKIRKAVFRKSDTFSCVQIGPMQVDLENGDCNVDEKRIPFTSSEGRFIALLARNLKRTVSRDAALSGLYAEHGGEEPEDKIIDVFITKIRKKLDDAYIGLSKCIQTRWGVGYEMLPWEEAKVLRSARESSYDLIDIGGVSINVHKDTGQGKLSDGQTLLSRRELTLLGFLAANQKNLYTESELQRAAYGALNVSSGSRGSISGIIDTVNSKLVKAEGEDVFQIQRHAGSYTLDVSGELDEASLAEVMASVTKKDTHLEDIGCGNFSLRVNMKTNTSFIADEENFHTFDQDETVLLYYLANRINTPVSVSKIREDAFYHQSADIDQILMGIVTKLKAINPDWDTLVAVEGGAITLSSEKVEEQQQRPFAELDITQSPHLFMGPGKIVLGCMLLDKDEKTFSLAGQDIEIDDIEFVILRQLSESPNKLIKRETLQEAIDGEFGTQIDDSMFDKAFSDLWRKIYKVKQDMAPALYKPPRSATYGLNTSILETVALQVSPVLER